MQHYRYIIVLQYSLFQQKTESFVQVSPSVFHRFESDTVKNIYVNLTELSVVWSARY